MEKKSVCEKENFESIFNDNSESLRNFIYYKSGDLKQAEDVVQDAFIKLWKNCEKVSFEKAISYLYTVARNNLLNYIAHQKVVLKYQQIPRSDISNQDPQFLIEEKEFMSKFKNAIDDLPVKQREAFLLSRIDKKSYKEIAEISGITVKGVEKRIHYALLGLREKLGDIL
ncbi:RNA polymerase sigma-70 factor [Aquimarina sp. 2201CG5-10]|uniref:RNA polymerase sigma factor n=1 Tax=Aquimarina callyspongiae TaxID=3098150 RepID=UPI002AB40B06|nr:RNA polymerase sigma-70 factor [Aquimarina sp. 2201CG5-10]MDY8136443.1 RNA polymerase sigma-70 factor [Aquimarina sp. 2201CG5-10]